MSTTPFLKLPSERSMWTAKAEGWFSLNSQHEWFEEGRPYHGVLHAEVLPRESTIVLNLGVQTGDGAQAFSFSFTKNQESVKAFKDHGLTEADEKKALKIACELVCHLQDPMHKELMERMSTRLAQLELNGAQSVWERV